MIIDAHQHFWALARGDYGWLTPALGPLYRDHLPEDLAPHLRRAGVSRTVLVQAAPTEDETRFMLEIARNTPFVAAVVGWADMEVPDFDLRVDALVGEGGDRLAGLRPMVQDIGDDAWIASPALDAAFDAIVARGLRFDALVMPRHLPHLERRLERTPDLDVVIDHAAKPDIAGGGHAAWSRALARLAGAGRVHCKLSGLLTEAGPDWNRERVRPYVDTVLELFGPARVMWGSDWPVLNLASDYATWFDLARACLQDLPDAQARQVLGGTAADFYGLQTEG